MGKRIHSVSRQRAATKDLLIGATDDRRSVASRFSCGDCEEQMTGAFLRVKRDGKFENVEVEHLTDEEREDKLANDPRLMSWLHLVCRELVRAEELFEELEADGVLQRGPSA